MNGKDLVAQAKQTILRLTNAQKIILSALIIGGIVAISSLLYWTARPDYVVLFSSLGEQDGGKILNFLQESNIPYQFEMNGSTIKVPRENVYEIRLKLANMGLPEQKGVGYELFDKVNFGMSDFMQKLNYRRALEGELSRTIIALEEVEAARVHLVIPEASLFADKEKPTTASITLKLKPNAQLSQGQVQGMAFLVSGAVEGLKMENVTIVDAKGNVLTNPMERDPVAAMSSTQMQLQKQVETSMQANVQSMLDKLLGVNKSIVRVTAKLDFQRIEEQKELFDSQNPVVRSEERNESNSTGGNEGTTTTENTVTNYEISRSVQKIVGGVGYVQKVSLAVILDGTYKKVGTGDDAKREYLPRNDQEMKNIASAIRGAVGFDENRGDRLELSNVPFDVTQIEQQNEEFKQTEKMEFWRMVIERGVLVIGALIVLLMVRGFLKKYARSSETLLERTLVEINPQAAEQLMPGMAVAGALPGAGGSSYDMRHLDESQRKQLSPLPDLDTQFSEESLQIKQLQDQLEEFAISSPETAARLLKTWMIEN